MAETVDLGGDPPPGPDGIPRPPWFRVIGRADPGAWVGCALALIGTGAAVAGLQPLPLAAAYAVMLIVAITAAMVDAVDMRLPDVLTYPILAGGVAVLAALDIAGTNQGCCGGCSAVSSTAGSCWQQDRSTHVRSRWGTSNCVQALGYGSPACRGPPCTSGCSPVRSCSC